MTLLSICIPTYNRSAYLKKCLEAIFSQTDTSSSIEMVVCDNASTDETSVIMKEFIGKHLSLRYFKNATNEGPDRNVSRCYMEAKGIYVMVMGDDDILLPGSLDRIILLLKTDKYGVVFLNYYSFTNNHISERPRFNLFQKDYVYRAEAILKKIRGNLAFISAYVIKNELIDRSLLIKYSGTHLNHVPPILKAINSSEKTVFVGDYLLAQKGGNSGGFRYFEVFSKNFHKVLEESLGESNSMRWICNEFISNVFPWAMLQSRRKVDPEFFEENGYTLIKSLYKKYPAFWIFVYPMSKLPAPLIGIYFFFVKVVAKCLYFLRRIHLGHAL